MVSQALETALEADFKEVTREEPTLGEAVV